MGSFAKILLGKLSNVKAKNANHHQRSIMMPAVLVVVAKPIHHIRYCTEDLTRKQNKT